MGAISIRKWLLLLVFLEVSTNLIHSENTVKKKITVSTLLQPPLVMLDETTDEYTGYMIDFLTHSGYECDIKPVLDSKFGMEEQPRKLMDALKEVALGNADIAIVGIDSENRKAKDVKFTQPVFELGYVGLYKIPEEWNPSYTAMMTLIEPFTPGLWCLILFMCVLASGALYLLQWFSPYDVVTAKDSPTQARPQNFMYMFASLWGQSSSNAPGPISARVLVGVWWVFSLMTGAAYIGGLLAVLLRMNPQVNTLPFGNTPELMRQTEVDVIVVKDGATHRFIRNHQFFNKSMIWRQWTHRLDELTVDSMNAALTKMDQQDGKYVIYTSEVTANYLANSLPCNKMIVANALGDQYYGFACKSGSTLCDELDQAIIRLWETGYTRKAMHRYTGKGCRDGSSAYFYQGRAYIDTFGVGDPNWLSPMTLTIKRFSGAFVMLVIGVVAAVLVLIAEILYARWKGQRFAFEGGRRPNNNDGPTTSQHDFSLNQSMPS